MTDSNQNENIEILDELNDWLVTKIQVITLDSLTGLEK
jgi:hypothetical protein